MSTESDTPFQVGNKSKKNVMPQRPIQPQPMPYYPNNLEHYPEPNRREMGSWLKSILLMGAGIGAVVATEKFAPKEYKVSTIVGSYEANIEEQVTERVKNIETYYLSELEAYKGEVGTFVEASNAAARARNESVLQYYKAAYDRAQVMAQALVQMRAFIVQKFVNIAETLNAADLGISSGALAGGRLIGLFDPELGEAFRDYGTEGGEIAAKRIEDYFNRGMAIQLPDQDEFLPSLEDIQTELSEIETPASPKPPRLVRYSDLNTGE